jgi:hypothetical protein
LERALRLFPSHRLFLSLYIHWESRTRIEGRLRRFFDATLQRQNHPVLWLFAIRSEVVRLGSAHRIRSLFERALERTSECVPLLHSHCTSRTRAVAVTSHQMSAQLLTPSPLLPFSSARCIVLWRYYLRFEVGQHDEAAALRIYYRYQQRHTLNSHHTTHTHTRLLCNQLIAVVFARRAINQIPYSKALWLDAFRLFHSTLQERDVSRLLDLMVEKEARLRNDVEEIQTTISDVLGRIQKKEEKKERLENQEEAMVTLMSSSSS